jgi:hypothetical protein
MPPEFKRASSAREQADQKQEEERNKLLLGETRAWGRSAVGVLSLNFPPACCCAEQAETGDYDEVDKLLRQGENALSCAAARLRSHAGNRILTPPPRWAQGRSPTRTRTTTASRR